MNKIDKLLLKAQNYIGTKEIPANSNNVVFNTDYYGRPVNGSAYPWCMTFMWDIFRLCGLSEYFYDGKKTASCTTLLNWAKQKNKFYTKGKIGDLAIFEFGSVSHRHVGIVYNIDDKYVYTIDGNTSNTNEDNGGMVMRKKRSLSTVIGFVRCINETNDNITKIENIGADYMFTCPTLKLGSDNQNAMLLWQTLLRGRGYSQVGLTRIWDDPTYIATLDYKKRIGEIPNNGTDATITATTWKSMINL